MVQLYICLTEENFPWLYVQPLVIVGWIIVMAHGFNVDFFTQCPCCAESNMY